MALTREKKLVRHQVEDEMRSERQAELAALRVQVRLDEACAGASVHGFCLLVLIALFDGPLFACSWRKSGKWRSDNESKPLITCTMPS